MKLKNILLCGILAMSAAFNCAAQSGFNYFEEPRTIALTWPTNLTTTTSNLVIDIHGFEGIGTVDMMALSNTTGVTITALLSTSPDRTNWTAVTYALATSNNVIYTNLYYGSGTPLATNQLLRAGTLTTPTASSAGFASKYVLPAPYTNTGTVSIGTLQLATVGFSVPDAGRYLQIAWTITGTSTNAVSAVFKGRKQQE